MARISASAVSTDAGDGTSEAVAQAAVGPRSRRSLLAGAMGAAAAALAAVLARPDRAEAAAGSTMIIGSETNNAGSANTQLLTNSSVVAFKLLQNGPGTALMGYATPVTGATRGVYGRVDSPNGDGIQARNAGSAGTGAAIRAYGGANAAILATTDPEITVIRGLSGGATIEQIHPSGEFAEAAGEFAGATGVIGASTAGLNGVIGLTDVGTGVYGKSPGSGTGVRGQTVSGFGVLAQATSSGIAIYAQSSSGSAVYGVSTSGYAGYFENKVFFNGHLDVDEISTPGAPAANQARLFAKDDGLGKTQLCVIFPGGNVVVLGTST